MISILLSNACSDRLHALTNVSWIKRGDPSSTCDVIITETILDIDQSILQVVFVEDETIMSSASNVYISKYKHSLHEYLDYICECTRNKIAVHVFGDSHSIITHKITICRENWLGFNTHCPITMFRMGNEGLDVHEAIRVMGNGHEKYPVRKGDVVMYSYGEIDARYLILKHCTTNEGICESLTGNYYKEYREIDDMMNTLITKYIKQIKWNEEKFGCSSFVYFIVPPSHKIEGLNGNVYTGTLDERKQLYSNFTEKLYSMCKENKIPVISIYDAIINTDGTVKEEYLVKEGDIHINNEYYYLIRDKIMEELCRD